MHLKLSLLFSFSYFHFYTEYCRTSTSSIKHWAKDNPRCSFQELVLQPAQGPVQEPVQAQKLPLLSQLGPRPRQAEPRQLEVDEARRRWWKCTMSL